MNKQEAIEYFKNKEKGYFIKPSQINVSTTEVIHILNQIDEPQEVVIPECVADWIEKNKSDINTLYTAYTLLSQRKKRCVFVGKQQSRYLCPCLVGWLQH